jgi:hypothetical protein
MEVDDHATFNRAVCSLVNKGKIVAIYGSDTIHLKTKKLTALRSAARKEAGANRSTPIDILAKSDQAPEMTGEAGYTTTPSGKTTVRHPGAYGNRCVYHVPTLHVTVGQNWKPAVQNVPPELESYDKKENQKRASGGESPTRVFQP